MGRPAKRVKREVEVEAGLEVGLEPQPRCFLTEIPVEIRLLIFDFVLADTNTITISVAEVERNIFDDSEPEESIEGIPGKYVPLVKKEFDLKMMEIGKLGVVPPPDLLSVTGSMDSGYGSFGRGSVAGGRGGRFNQPEVPLLTSMSLLLTNRQIHDEMAAYIKYPTSKRSNLHVNYPYGIIVLETLYPSLLQYTERICISGWYDSKSDGSLFASPNSTSHSSPAVPLSETTEDVYAIANSALARLIRTLMSSTDHPTLTSLSLRIFYPCEAQYSFIWSCNDSPVVVALRNMCGGKVDMKVLRGNCGNGIVMNVEPTRRDRHLTTTWRRFQGSRTEEVEAWRAFGDEKVWVGAGPGGQSWSVA